MTRQALKTESIEKDDNIKVPLLAWGLIAYSVGFALFEMFWRYSRHDVVSFADACQSIVYYNLPFIVFAGKITNTLSIDERTVFCLILAIFGQFMINAAATALGHFNLNNVKPMASCISVAFSRKTRSPSR
jgi:predicted membrane channel-forming protein YqfA (hemolysin III family)